MNEEQWEEQEEMQDEPERAMDEAGHEPEPVAEESGWEEDELDIRKPENDREWGDWRKKTQAQAQRIATESRMALDAEIAQKYGHLTNPVTGAAVQSGDDYFAALEAQEWLEAQGQAAPQGMTGMDFGMGAAAAQVAELERGNRLLDDQVAQLGRMDSSIRCFEDLRRMPNFAEFDRLVRNGQDLVSAYKVVNFERTARKSAAAARQAALNAQAGKRHLAKTPTGGGGQAGAEIPQAALEMWQELFPGESPGRLRERYNKTYK